MSDNGQGEQLEQETQKAPRASARPLVVIQIEVAGRKQIYDVETARDMLSELQLALASLDDDKKPAEGEDQAESPADSPFPRTRKKKQTKK